MDTATLPFSATETSADRLATENFRANIAALNSTQPGLVPIIGESAPAVRWLFARDGCLTAQADNGWQSGCSVPLRAAREMLKKLELHGGVGCFLNPTHAAQIRACFEKISPTQALICVMPDRDSLPVLLGCDRFAAEIAAARLFFVAGTDWAEQLADLFSRHPGLPLPQQFLRTILLDEADMAALSGEAQSIISRETSRRGERLKDILAAAETNPRSGRVLVMAGSRFKLDDLSNFALRRALLDAAEDSTFAAFDPDFPLTASPPALAEAAMHADALVAADLFRSDLPGIVSPKTAWITWITNGRIGKFRSQWPTDALLLADPKWRPAARDAGWPDERIQIAAWPEFLPTSHTPACPASIAIFSDIRTIEVPQRVKDLSSQLLLWEMIEEELANRPWSLGENPERYLLDRMARFNIAEEGFDRSLFWDRLIAPAYQMGLCRFLLRSGVPLAIFGRGWKDLAEFQPHARGEIAGLDDLTAAVSQCTALLQPLPMHHGSTGAPLRPTIQPAGLAPAALLKRVREALNNPKTDHDPGAARLNKSHILPLLSPPCAQAAHAPDR
jgi:hypothetical protein